MMIHRSAAFSDCRRYRYRLERVWDPDRPRALFVMLNPSTADSDADDNTIRRCVRFAQSWGYGRLLVGNLFAYRSSEPMDLKRVRDPVGPENDAALLSLATEADLVVAAWGRYGVLLGRDRAVQRMMPVAWHALSVTRDGHPKHPLYLPRNVAPVPYP